MVSFLAAPLGRCLFFTGSSCVYTLAWLARLVPSTGTGMDIKTRVFDFRKQGTKQGTVEPVKNQAPAQKSGLMQAERGTSADVSVPISWAFHDIDSIKPLTRFRLYLCATGLFHQLHCPYLTGSYIYNHPSYLEAIDSLRSAGQ